MAVSIKEFKSILEEEKKLEERLKTAEEKAKKIIDSAKKKAEEIRRKILETPILTEEIEKIRNKASKKSCEAEQIIISYILGD